MQSIIITNPELLNKKIQAIKEDGKDKLHIVSDFDRTLTKYYVNGKKIPSIIALIREGGYLSPEYVKKAFELYDIYHPIEVNPNISPRKKSIKMHEWWRRHFDQIIKYKMTKDVILEIIKKDKIPFRKKSKEFFNILDKNKIPLIIMSATMGDIVLESLKYEKLDFPNIHLIANMLIWNKDGEAIGVKEPIIHTVNKHEIEMKSHPVYNELLKRKNIILLGDLVEDLDMVRGFPYKNLIKIGFFNDSEEDLESFKKNFDIIITNDSDMSYVNELLKEIVG